MGPRPIPTLQSSMSCFLKPCGVHLRCELVANACLAPDCFEQGQGSQVGALSGRVGPISWNSCRNLNNFVNHQRRGFDEKHTAPMPPPPDPILPNPNSENKKNYGIPELPLLAEWNRQRSCSSQLTFPGVSTIVFLALSKCIYTYPDL